MSVSETNGQDHCGRVDGGPIVHAVAEATRARPEHSGGPTPTQLAWQALRSIAGSVGMDDAPGPCSPPEAFDELVGRVEGLARRWVASRGLGVVGESGPDKGVARADAARFARPSPLGGPPPGGGGAGATASPAAAPPCRLCGRATRRDGIYWLCEIGAGGCGNVMWAGSP